MVLINVPKSKNKQLKMSFKREINYIYLALRWKREIGRSNDRNWKAVILMSGQNIWDSRYLRQLRYTLIIKFNLSIRMDGKSIGFKNIFLYTYWTLTNLIFFSPYSFEVINLILHILTHSSQTIYLVTANTVANFLIVYHPKGCCASKNLQNNLSLNCKGFIVNWVINCEVMGRHLYCQGSCQEMR